MKEIYQATLGTRQLVLYKCIIFTPTIYFILFHIISDKIYTGLGDGRIVQITDSKITDVVRTGKSCGKLMDLFKM